MIDKWLYNFFGFIDKVFSKLETYAISFSTWLWHKRLNLLNKRRGRKNEKM